MSQLPDEIYIRQESKHGTLDFVTAYLYPWAFEEDGYKMEDMQMYIPSYRLQEFAALVRKMREAQSEHAIADMKLRYHQQADREIPDDVWNSFACTMDWMVSCEDAVDEYLKKMEI